MGSVLCCCPPNEDPPKKFVEMDSKYKRYINRESQEQQILDDKYNKKNIENIIELGSKKEGKLILSTDKKDQLEKAQETIISTKGSREMKSVSQIELQEGKFLGNLQLKEENCLKLDEILLSNSSQENISYNIFNKLGQKETQEQILTHNNIITQDNETHVLGKNTFSINVDEKKISNEIKIIISKFENKLLNCEENVVLISEPNSTNLNYSIDYNYIDKKTFSNANNLNGYENIENSNQCLSKQKFDSIIEKDDKKFSFTLLQIKISGILKEVLNKINSFKKIVKNDDYEFFIYENLNKNRIVEKTSFERSEYEKILNLFENHIQSSIKINEIKNNVTQIKKENKKLDRSKTICFNFGNKKEISEEEENFFKKAMKNFKEERKCISNNQVTVTTPKSKKSIKITKMAKELENHLLKNNGKSNPNLDFLINCDEYSLIVSDRNYVKFLKRKSTLKDFKKIN